MWIESVWMDVWMDVCTARQSLNGWVNGCTVGPIDWWMDAQSDQWMGGWMHSQTNGWVDGCTVGPMDGWMDAQLDQSMGGWMHSQFNK